MKKKHVTTKRDFSSLKKTLIPPLVGLFVGVLVFGVFNSQLLSGKVAAGRTTLTPQQTTSVNETLQKSQPESDTEATIHIAKLNIDAPVAYQDVAEDEALFQQLLQEGVVHYPNTALPGHKGNVVIFGHSSGRWWAPGNYKFIFSQLDKLVFGDKIFIDFDGKRFEYQVTKQEVVAATDISVLTQKDGHILTLITCYPVGTNAKRLIITAKQTLPVPEEEKIPTQTPSVVEENQQLPGQIPSFWDSLRSIF